MQLNMLITIPKVSYQDSFSHCIIVCNNCIHYSAYLGIYKFTHKRFTVILHKDNQKNMEPQIIRFKRKLLGLGLSRLYFLRDVTKIQK